MTDPMAGFLAAVAQLPVYAGVVWRAADFELSTPITSDAPIPTSRDLRVATENFRVSGVHLIVATNGRDIAPFSAHTSDAEVVLLPGARLVPASAFHEVANLRVQVVLEQPVAGVAIPSVPTDGEIADLIRGARAAGDVGVAQPGRFGAA